MRVSSIPGKRGSGHVLYWCTHARRTDWNHALDHAVGFAKEHNTSLIILESVDSTHPYASSRSHAFARQGMQDQADALKETPIGYVPIVPTDSASLETALRAAAADAQRIIVDHYPYPGEGTHVEMAKRTGRPIDIVDGNCITPLAATAAPYKTAAALRRWLQKTLPEHLESPPPRRAWDELLPATIPEALAACPQPAKGTAWIDELELPCDVPQLKLEGGSNAAKKALNAFLARRDGYLERNEPDANAESGLSPYLRWGHLGAHQAVAAMLAAEDWNPGRLGRPTGARQGWWGTSAAAEAWLDQIITWRTIGFIELHHRPDAHTYESLPDWARATLQDHAADPRSVVPEDVLEVATTADPIWNAAQQQLRTEGKIHNYMRMLWGKNILAWSKTPQAAMATMLRLNDTWAIDGRDPNSLSGVAWCLGRYDRGWPERPVYGKVRCMTSASAKRKLHLDAYLERYAHAPRGV